MKKLTTYTDVLERAAALGTSIENRDAFVEQYHLEEQDKTPLPVKLLTMAGAWISSVLLTSFLFLFKIFDSDESYLTGGFVFVATSLIVSRYVKKYSFMDPFIVSIGLIGQGLIMYALEEIYSDSEAIYIFMIIIQTTIFLLSINTIQHFLSVLFIQLCLFTFLVEIEMQDAVQIQIGLSLAIFTFLICYEETIVTVLRKFHERYVPVLLGLALSAVSLLTLSSNKYFMKEIEYWWLTSIFILLCIGFATYKIIQHLHLLNTKWYMSAFSIIILAPLVQSPGIFAGLLFLLLGFYRKLWLITGIGVLALIYFFTMFYYNLQFTLLTKSLLLMGSGILAIGGRFLLNRFKL